MYYLGEVHNSTYHSNHQFIQPDPDVDLTPFLNKVSWSLSLYREETVSFECSFTYESTRLDFIWRTRHLNFMSWDVALSFAGGRLLSVIDRRCAFSLWVYRTKYTHHSSLGIWSVTHVTDSLVKSNFSWRFKLAY